MRSRADINQAFARALDAVKASTSDADRAMQAVRMSALPSSFIQAIREPTLLGVRACLASTPGFAAEVEAEANERGLGRSFAHPVETVRQRADKLLAGDASAPFLVEVPSGGLGLVPAFLDCEAVRLIVLDEARRIRLAQVVERLDAVLPPPAPATPSTRGRF